MLNLKLLLISFALFFLAGCSTPGTYTIDEPIPVREEIHQANHDGLVYHYSQTGTMNAGDVLYFMGCTGNESDVHFIDYELLATANPIILEFYENPTINTTNGILVNSSIMNRQSNLTATMDLYVNPDVSNDGKLLFTKAILGTQNKDSGQLKEGLDWILNTSTCYTFKITNNDGNNVDIYANFFWFEEPRD